MIGFHSLQIPLKSLDTAQCHGGFTFLHTHTHTHTHTQSERTATSRLHTQSPMTPGKELNFEGFI